MHRSQTLYSPALARRLLVESARLRRAAISNHNAASCGRGAYATPGCACPAPARARHLRGTQTGPSADFTPRTRFQLFGRAAIPTADAHPPAVCQPVQSDSTAAEELKPAPIGISELYFTASPRTGKPACCSAQATPAG